MPNYYDGTKLLNKKDINGLDPNIFICATNRSAGKTTYFHRLLYRKYLKRKEKVMFLFRYKYELDSLEEKLFMGVVQFFKGYELKAEVNNKVGLAKLYLVHGDKEMHCGFAACINSADQVKKYSHIFQDVDWIFMDEFQSEDNKYCKDEIKKFLSIYISVARGKGQRVRDVKVILCGNHITIVNPYYLHLGITKKLKKDTKYLRGDGYVLETNFYSDIQEEAKENGVFSAFDGEDYIQMGKEMKYLNDNNESILKAPARVKYLCTCKNQDVLFSIKYDAHYIYVCESYDLSCKTKISPRRKGDAEFESIANFPYLSDTLKSFYQKGKTRFETLELKEQFYEIL